MNLTYETSEHQVTGGHQALASKNCKGTTCRRYSNQLYIKDWMKLLKRCVHNQNITFKKQGITNNVYVSVKNEDLN